MKKAQGALARRSISVVVTGACEVVMNPFPMATGRFACWDCSKPWHYCLEHVAGRFFSYSHTLPYNILYDSPVATSTDRVALLSNELLDCLHLWLYKQKVER